MKGMLARWNQLQPADAADEILPCCGSRAWAQGMTLRRPLQNQAALLAASGEIWWNLSESDWLEAFRNHPRIGEPAARSAPSRTAAWSREEQQRAVTASDETKAALADANRAYEERFHRIFIVCATNKSAPEILEILQRRLRNDEATELRETAEQQQQIVHIRLKKWLSS